MSTTRGSISSPDVAPSFPRPVTESQATMLPGTSDYTSREGCGSNMVAAEQVLLDSGSPVTVLRPSKTQARGALRPREWVFVKRALDRRPAVLLAHRGRTAGAEGSTQRGGQPRRPRGGRRRQAGARILNSADPEAPTGLEIARTIAAHLGHTWEEVLLDDDAPTDLGRHPWDSHPP